MESEDPTLFGLSLSTHRPKDLGPEASTYFQFEAAVAAISICIFRSTVYFKYEPALLRWFFTILLSFLAYSKRPYELISAVEIFSYAVPYLLFSQNCEKQEKNRYVQSPSPRLLSIAAGAVLSFLVAHVTASGHVGNLLSVLTPGVLVRGLKFMFPVDEMVAAYNMLAAFANPTVLQKQLSHLFFVTFHIQVSMGFIGIDFLRREQDRRNQLVRMDVAPTTSELGAGVSAPASTTAPVVPSATSTPSQSAAGSTGTVQEGKGSQSLQAVMMDRARRFQRTAPAFILVTALPYMFQIIMYGNLNKFAFTCVRHDMHRTVRLNELFDHDNYLMTMSTNTATSPEAYAMSIDKVLDIAYDIWNRKLFSLPKILLLPAVMSKQPMLVLQVFPIIFVSDWIKASVMSAMTNKVEDLEKELKDLRAIRSKIESFDIKNAELLQRSGKGATQFTQRRWEELTVKIQARIVVSDLISRSKLFFSFIQRNFIFSVLIDCALASLIAVGKIVSADTFVFSRAVEDTVDMILMRSRAEADLARMMTEIDKLQQLADTWERSKTRSLIHCRLDPSDGNNVILRNLAYNRGTAYVRADHIELSPGVYALTGSNGSGKSTLFRILMSCHTNEKPIDLPPSINLLTPMEPLCEEDDLRREITCDVDDQNDGDQEATVEIGPSGEIGGLSRGLSEVGDPVPHPRLAISMPSDHVVEISQTFYWPLYSRPIDWMYQEHVLETCSPDQLELKVRKVAEQLRSLEFLQSVGNQLAGNEDRNTSHTDDPESAMIQQIRAELLAEKEDWFSDLSGGQKSKCELVRKVFLHDRCPEVLLIDETMAPLDPSSKALVMGKLKRFCKDSIVIVIYHTDVGRETEVGGKTVDCVPSNDFFTKNLHIAAGIVHVRDVC